MRLNSGDTTMVTVKNTVSKLLKFLNTNCSPRFPLTPRVDHCRKLETETFPKGSGSLYEDIVAIKCSLDDLALLRSVIPL